MRWSSLAIALLNGVALASDATTTSSDSASSSSVNLADASTITPSSVAIPSGPYSTYSTTITLGNGESSLLVSSMLYGNASATPTANQTIVTASNTLTVLSGHGANTSAPIPNASQTPVVNTQPCNGWPEFCSRRYSNVTMVAAHNSPFVQPGNAASNQALDVTQQLNDGVRMLQFQTHYQNGTMMLCHTSCDLLNMGTLEAYLTQVNAWVRQHPYDVVTILMGNFDFVKPENYTAPIEQSGLSSLVYTPTKIPMGLDDWPNLSEMILTGKRVLFFLDYNANQTAMPWLMDEFSQIWETPYSPTNRQFPCTEQRPPGLSDEAAKDRMYMANHNLNLQLNLGTISMLIPNTALINQTNGASGFGSLGMTAQNCTAMWGRPPNFLLVDYYNYGSPQNGSVFEVAAKMNNVTYDWNSCCGKTSAAVPGISVTSVSTLLAVAASLQFLLSVF